LSDQKRGAYDFAKATPAQESRPACVKSLLSQGAEEPCAQKNPQKNPEESGHPEI
jgi:hypothetical protein